MSKSNIVVALLVKNIETGEVVKRLAIEPTRNDSYVEKMTMSLLRNMNTEQYFVDEEVAQ